MKPLTPSRSAKIIQNLFTNKKDVKREYINKAVQHYYENEVGKVNTTYGQSFEIIVTKALGILKKNGQATNEGGYGYWDFRDVSQSEDQTELYPIEESQITSESRKINPGKIIGPSDGPKTVYIYYYPAYKELAELKNEKYWRCKIGHTESIDSVFRIQSQITTEICEPPIVPFLVKTKNSYGLEKSIHTIIENRGRKCQDALGTEWYFTNPDEIEEIVRIIENY